MGEYSVKTGDNLWNIVKREFNLSNTNDIAQKVQEVAKNNNIKNPDSIFAGQKISFGKDLKETPMLKASNDIKSLHVEPIKIDLTNDKTLNQLAQKITVPQKIEIQRNYIPADPKAHGPNPGFDAYIPDKTPIRTELSTNEENDKNLKSKRYSTDNPSFFAKHLQYNTVTEKMKAMMKKHTEELQEASKDKSEDILKIKSIMDEIELDQPEFQYTDDGQLIESQPAPKVRKVKGAEITAPRKRVDNTAKTAEATKTKAKRKTRTSNLHSIDVTTKYTGTAQQLDTHLGGVLKGKGAHLLRLQELYGINAAFLAAIAINESANGTSYSARKRNNVGGVRKAGSTKFKVYVNVEACLDDMANFLKRNYIDKGRTTVGKVGAKYCPTSDHTDTSGLNQYWPRNVGTYMTQIDPNLTAKV